MATYKVGSDGKAQSGLKAGDQVVTAGGTYTIKSVNADGSYNSSLTNKSQTTSNYSGSYASSGSSGSNSGASGGSSSKSSGGGSSSSGKSYSSSPSANGTSYNVTSQKGIDFIEKAAAGQTMIGGDGSTWTKNADGSTTINQNGKSYTIAGSGSGGSGGGNNTTSSSVPSTTKGYTSAPSSNGKTYTVTSDLGIYFVESARPGETMIGGDGSKWTKNADGSTTINQGGNFYTIGGTGNGTSAVQENIPYTPEGIYLDQGVSQADAAALEALSQQYEYYKSIGDMASANAAHEQAEAIRAKYGYSGNVDGSQYVPIKQAENTIPQTGLPTYEPQTEQVKELYEAAAKNAQAALTTAYNQSRLDQEAAMAKIAPLYAAQRNAIGAENEIEKANFREAAAASGLNAGAGAQAQLSMSNDYLNALTANRNAQASAEANAELELTKLYTEYQDSIAEALEKNEYEKAAALLAEYQTAAKSAVEVAQAQAEMNVKTAGFNRETYYDNKTLEQQDWENAYKTKQQLIESAQYKLYELGSSALSADELSAIGMTQAQADNAASLARASIQGLYRYGR